VLQRDVALRTIDPAVVDGRGDLIAAFEDEIRVTVRDNDAPKVFDTGHIEDAPFLVTALADVAQGTGRESQPDVAGARGRVPAERPRRRAVPLSLRLTGTLALVVAAGMCVVAGLAVQRSRSHLEHDLDARLEAVVASFKDGPATSVVTQADLAAATREWMATLPHPSDQVVIVRTADGQVLSTRSTLNIRDLITSDDLLVSTRGGWRTLDAQDGRVRVVTVPLVLEGDEAGTLLAAASTSSIESTTSALLRQMLVAGAVGFLLAASLVAVAVRRSLRPLRRISTEIATIQAGGDLSRRVHNDGPADEVGKLATGFNGMLERLEEAFASQRQFIADASHELRTPLTVVRGQLELLGDELQQARDTRPTDLAVDEIDRMSRIVDDLLLLARLDEGLPVRDEPVEVELVAQEALLRIGDDVVRVEVRVEPGAVVRADSDRLLQVITNLVANALTHAGSDARVHLRGWHEGDDVCIAVADNGPGINAEELPRVFERFYRSPASRSSGAAGSGLGLAIVESLVTCMRGTVSVSSAPGEGTRFVVTLPSA
jgi:two-component system OmpR family sensor kinase